MKITTIVTSWKRFLQKIKALLTPGKDAWVRTP
jgi:hypothetical protein